MIPTEGALQGLSRHSSVNLSQATKYLKIEAFLHSALNSYAHGY